MEKVEDLLDESITAKGISSGSLLSPMGRKN